MQPLSDPLVEGTQAHLLLQLVSFYHVTLSSTWGMFEPGTTHSALDDMEKWPTYHQPLAIVLKKKITIQIWGSLGDHKCISLHILLGNNFLPACAMIPPRLALQSGEY